MLSKRILMTVIVIVVVTALFTRLNYETLEKAAIQPIQTANIAIARNVPLERTVKKENLITPPIKVIDNDKTAINHEITICEDYGEAYDEAYDKKFEAEVDLINEDLARLDTMESNFVNLLFEKENKNSAIEKTKLLSEKYSSSDLIDYHLLLLCSDNVEHCSESLITDTTNKLSNNSAAWLLKAVYYAEKSNLPAAEAAIIEASKAPDFNSYKLSYLSAISDAFQQIGDSDTKLRDEIKFGHIYAIPKIYPKALIDQCEQTSSDNLALIEACLTAGQIWQQDNTDQMLKALGFRMQEIALTKINRTESLANLTIAQQTHIDLVREEIKAFNLLWRNTPLRQAMLRQLMEHGEITYAKFAVAEAIKLSNASNVDECQAVP